MRCTLSTAVYPEDVEVFIEVKFDAYYEREHISGPVEDCYPAESSLEIQSITFDTPGVECYDADQTPLTSEEIRKYIERPDVQMKLEEECWDAYWDVRREY